MDANSGDSRLRPRLAWAFTIGNHHCRAMCANALETICEAWSLASSPQGDYALRRSRSCGFGTATSCLNQGIRQLSLPHRHFALQLRTCRRVGWETIDDHQVHPYGGLADREGLPLCRQRDDGASPGKPVCGPYRGWVNSPGSTVSPTYRSRATSKTWGRCHRVRSTAPWNGCADSQASIGICCRPTTIRTAPKGSWITSSATICPRM